MNVSLIDMKPWLQKFQNNDILLKEGLKSLTPTSTKINVCQVETVGVTKNSFQKVIYKLVLSHPGSYLPPSQLFKNILSNFKEHFKNNINFHFLNNQFCIISIYYTTSVLTIKKFCN